MSDVGSIPIRCPWIEEHSCDSGPTETVYFPTGTGGFEQGHFRCLHASHEHKTDADFLEAIGYAADGFENISQEAVIHSLIAGVPNVSDVPNPLDLPNFERQPKTAKIKPIVNNLLLFMDWLAANGEGIQFDVFNDEITIDTPRGRRPFTDADYIRIQSKAERGAQGFAPLNYEMIRRVVHTVAQDHCFDSAKEWVDRLPVWDGVPRVDTFCSTYLRSEHTPYTIAVARYLWSAMAGRLLAPGTKADMAMILVSPQGTGKSMTVRTMAPTENHYVDLSLSDKDADLARMTRGKSLAELSELRGLHTKEMDSIKSFVTRLDSEWIPKFFEMRTKYQRRFIMIGTTNNDEFLGDVTGERRWLPVRVGIQHIEAIRRDHAQLWAEGAKLFREHGVIWREAQTLGRDEHAEFSTYDALADKLRRWLDASEFGRTPASCEFLHLYDVMKDGLGYDDKDMSRVNQLRVGDALRRLGYANVQKWIDGRNHKVWVPKTIPPSPADFDWDRWFS